jgi:hypothetical protein
MYRHQNAGQNHDIEIANWCFESVLERQLTNQNLSSEEIKREPNSGNACYHSVRNLSSSRLLSKNAKIKI